MPIYEYECTRCGNIEEALQKFSDKPLTKCRHCSGKLHKLVSQSTFHLKGTGWYVTDYADKSKKPSESAPKKTEDNKSVQTKSADTDAGKKKQSTAKSTWSIQYNKYLNYLIRYGVFKKVSYKNRPTCILPRPQFAKIFLKLHALSLYNQESMINFQTK